MKRKSSTARSRTAAATAHNSILSDPVPPDQTSSLFRIVSQEPIFAARLLSSPSNGADSPCWHRTYPRRFPRPRNALASAARARLQSNRQRKGVSKTSGPQFSRWGAGAHPNPAQGGQEALPGGSGRCWLLPVGRVGGRGAVGGRRWVGSLGGGNRGGAGIVGGCAIALDGLAVGWGGSRGGVTWNRPQPCHGSAQPHFGPLRSCGQFLRPWLQI